MMLKPFRIRNLYGPHHGIVQITAPQYDSTVISQPDAALTYLDDDDGEVITVGSSFELGQRLDEPVHHDPISLASLRLDTDTPIHIFDIGHSAASLATWREHEAYTSKTLRKKSVSSESTSTSTKATKDQDLGMWTTDQNGRPMYDRFVEREPEDYVYNHESLTRDLSSSQRYNIRDDGPRSPVLNLETASVLSGDRPPPPPPFWRSTKYKDAADKNNSSTGQTVIECAPADSQFTDNASSEVEPGKLSCLDQTSPPPVKEPETIGSEQIVASALQGLDNHLGGFADFLQNTSNAIRDAAEKTRETDTSAVESVLDGFRGILRDVGKIGRTMLETLDTEATAIAKEIAPLFAEEPKKKDNTVESSDAEKSTASKKLAEPTQDLKSTSVPSPAENSEPMQTQSPTLTKREHETANTFDFKNMNPRMKMEAFHALRSKGLVTSTSKPADIASIPPNYRIMKDCPVLPGMWQDTSSPHESHAMGSVRTGKLFKVPSLEWEIETKPSAPKQAASVATVDAPVVQPTSRPDERSEAQHTATPMMSKSILDLETSDPDFSIRYPPLMSLRRARTVAGLNNHTKSQIASTTQTALSRYPSIDQLEKKRGKISFDDFNPPGAAKKTKQPSVEDADDIDFPKKPVDSDGPYDHTKKYVPDAGRAQTETENGNATENVPKVDVEHVEPTRSSTQRLPGAWPETSNESQNSDHLQRKESSGAFFERMMRARGHSGLKPTSDTPTDIHSRIDARRLSGYRHVHPPRDLDPRPDHSDLHRSQTVTASNPAARLTRPFDPMLPSLTSTSHHRPGMPLFPRKSDEVPGRSGTERQHRRRQHWSERFNAANRQPFDPPDWETPIQTAPQPHLNAPHFGPRPMRSVPQFNTSAFTHGWDRSSPLRNSTSAARTKVDECITQLRDMGYGANDPHEASRLNVYAGAASGNVLDALDMIEEDRKGSWEAWLGQKKGQRKSMDDELI